MTLSSLLVRTAISVALLAATPPARAESPDSACGARNQVIARLSERYGETLRSLGLQQNNAVLEIYASDSTGTWSILVTHPDGTACLVASGQMWEEQARPLGAQGDDA